MARLVRLAVVLAIGRGAAGGRESVESPLDRIPPLGDGCRRLGSDRSMAIDCAIGNISVFPPAAANLPDETESLIRTIENGAFAHAVHMTNLVISHNTISRVTSRTFGRMANLKRLDLSFNQLVAVEQDALADMPALEWLSLHHNNIWLVRRQLFAPTDVILSGNHIVCSGSSFDSCSKCKNGDQLIIDGDAHCCSPELLLTCPRDTATAMAHRRKSVNWSCVEKGGRTICTKQTDSPTKENSVQIVMPMSETTDVVVKVLFSLVAIVFVCTFTLALIIIIGYLKHGSRIRSVRQRKQEKARFARKDSDYAVREDEKVSVSFAEASCSSEDNSDVSDNSEAECDVFGDRDVMSPLRSAPPSRRGSFADLKSLRGKREGSFEDVRDVERSPDRCNSTSVCSPIRKHNRKFKRRYSRSPSWNDDTNGVDVASDRPHLSVGKRSVSDSCFDVNSLGVSYLQESTRSKRGSSRRSSRQGSRTVVDHRWDRPNSPFACLSSHEDEEDRATEYNIRRLSQTVVNKVRGRDFPPKESSKGYAFSSEESDRPSSGSSTYRLQDSSDSRPGSGASSLSIREENSTSQRRPISAPSGRRRGPSARHLDFS